MNLQRHQSLELLAKRVSFRSKMFCRVTLNTECDEILLYVRARAAAILLMVYC